MFHEVHGEGEDVIVLLHGIPGSSRSWSTVVPFLSGHRVIVPDLLGFGRSPAASPDAHAAEQATAVLQLLDHAAVGEVHLVGFDFGGPVAVAIHTIAPHRVRRMTLMATNLLSDTPVPAPLRAARLPVVGDLLFRLLFSDLGLAMLWRGATANRQTFPLRAFRAVLDDRGNATARRLFLQSLRNLKTLYAPIETRLPEIRVPVTILWGDRDPFFSVAVGERMTRRFRAARWIVLPECGHFLPHERPREVAAAILE